MMAGKPFVQDDSDILPARLIVDNFVRSNSPKENSQRQSLNRVERNSSEPTLVDSDKSKKQGDAKSNLITIASLAEENSIIMKYLQKQQLKNAKVTKAPQASVSLRTHATTVQTTINLTNDPNSDNSQTNSKQILKKTKSTEKIDFVPKMTLNPSPSV